MSDLIKFENLNELIIDIRNEKVLLDADVAVIYGVETKRINEAVKNNSDRFPSGYVTELNEDDKNEPVENFARFSRLKHSSTTPRAFTENACICWPPSSRASKHYRLHYLLLRPSQNLRELTRSIKELSVIQDKAE